MNATPSVISLDHITVTRAGRIIIDDVSLTVGKGEHWAIVGPNGCGKTTLLKVIDGYLWPSRGTVTVTGDRYGEVDLREKRRRIGLVSSALFERIPLRDTFREVVRSGRAGTLGVWGDTEGADDGRADEVIRFLGFEHVSDSRYDVLSFGERQAALIGRALMADPEVLLLDEPCEGLDLAARERLLTTVNALIADVAGPTVLLVTHRIEEIAAGITNAAVMRNGRIVACGPVRDTLSGDILSRVYGVPVTIIRRNGRMAALVGGPPGSEPPLGFPDVHGDGSRERR